MSGLCECPLNATLTTISTYDCGIDFDQIVRLAFVKIQTALFIDEADMQTEASWDVLVAAVDDTKVVLTPPTVSLVIPSSEAQEEGGNDNTTINGVPNYLGENPVQIAGMINSMPSATYTEVRDLACQSKANIGKPLLMVYMFNRYNEVVFSDEAGDPVGFDIYNFRISTPGSEGFNALNKFNFTFYMDSEWADNFAISQLAFDPLTDI